MPLLRPKLWRLYIWLRRHGWSLAAGIAALVCALWLRQLLSNGAVTPEQRDTFVPLVAALIALVVVLLFRMAEGGFPLRSRRQGEGGRIGGALIWIACFFVIVLAIEGGRASYRYFLLRQQASCAQLSTLSDRNPSATLNRAQQVACSRVE